MLGWVVKTDSESEEMTYACDEAGQRMYVCQFISNILSLS